MTPATYVHLSWDMRPAVTLEVRCARTLTADELHGLAETVQAIQDFRELVSESDQVEL